MKADQTPELKELRLKFKAVEALIKSKPWFQKDKWVISQHPFPAAKPDGITLHVFKKHWFNEESLGIHFESYLDLNPKKHKKTYVTLHALHYHQFPNSKVSRKAFSQPLVDKIYSEVKARKGYAFRAGKYGLQPFTKLMDASSPQFSEELAGELEWLCKNIGPKVDETLKSVLAD